MRLLVPAIAALALASPAFAAHHESADHAEHSAAHKALLEAVANPAREDQGQRDKWRHPVETFEFFRIEPGMTVLDYFAGGGAWYGRILAPYLGADGKYIATVTTIPSGSDEQKASQRAFPERFPKLANEGFAKHGVKTAPILAYNLETKPEGADGTVDRVIIGRMMHNMHRWGMVHDQLGMLRALLKDDGLLGIVQHRAKADAPYSYADGNNGYMRQDDVIKLVEAHGFELVATSEINANPKDTADHEGGVWQLPPVWRSKDEAKKAIGESDRMTLLFRKSK
jgi:predicted methyltransferase